MLSIASDDPENGQPLWVCERIKVGQIFANEQEERHSQRVRKRRLAVERWKKEKKRKEKLSSVLHKGPGVVPCIVQQPHVLMHEKPQGCQESKSLSRQEERTGWKKKANGMESFVTLWKTSRWMDHNEGQRKKGKKKEREWVWETSSLQLPDRAVFADARNRRNPHLWNEYTGPAIPPNCGWTQGHSSINGRLFWNDPMCRY